jgi:hypothetical protein
VALLTAIVALAFLAVPAKTASPVIVPVYIDLSYIGDGILVENTTFVPLRLVAEALGLNVTWQQATQSVYLGTAPPAVEEPEEETPSTTTITVYVTKTGVKYHRWNCQYLKYSCFAISLPDALARGYTACSVCDPP